MTEKRKLTDEQVVEIFRLRATQNLSFREIGARFETAPSAIAHILHRRTYQDVLVPDFPIVIRHGGVKGRPNHSRPLTDDQVREMRRLSRAGRSHASLAEEFHMHPSAVGAVVCYRTYRDVRD